MPRPRTYQQTDQCVMFNFLAFLTNIQESMLRKREDHWSDAFMEEFRSNLEAFSLNGQKFEFVSVPLKLGGCRFYVRCPKCKEKKLRLFLPSRFQDREQRYLCSKCHGLKTYAQMNNKSKKYKAIIKPLNRMQYLKKKLLKYNIKPEEAAPLLEEYEKIEKSLQNSPEYRLWRFNVEHGKEIFTGVDR